MVALLLAGCLGTLAGAPTSQPGTPAPNGTPDPNGTPGPDGTPPADTVDFSGGVDCADTAWVSFWGLSGPPASAWAPDTVRVGWTVPGGQGFFLVASENGSRLGTSHLRFDGAVTADGDAVALDRTLSGPHEVRVVLHRDVDGNGAFDPSVDEPCRDDGELVQAGPQTIDFSRFEHGD